MNFFSLINIAIIILLIRICIKNKKMEKENKNIYLKFIHEVKNPLSVALGYIEIIKKKENVDKYLPIVSKNINDSIAIINDYLSFRNNSVNTELLDLNLMLKDITDDLKKIQELYNFNINFYYDEEELIILGDYVKLKQVFVNLIKNSIESSNNKRVEIDIDYKIVNNMILIEVSDNGCGIKELDLIGKNNYSTKSNGFGFGINISKKIIELHKGKISISSEVDKGTDVKIFLPCVNL